jgi:hypothetical protein
MTVCCSMHALLHDVLASIFILTLSQTLISSIRVLLPDIYMLYYMLDAQIFVASQFPAHKKKALSVLHSSFRSGAYLTENRV